MRGSLRMNRGYHAIWIAGLSILLLQMTALAQRPDTVWTRVLGEASSDVAEEVQVTSDGGYIIVGHTKSFGAIGADVCLIKMNAYGDTLWTRTYGGPNHDRGYSVQETSPGDGYIVAGKTLSFGSGSDDVYIIRTDADGDTLWTKTYGGTSYDIANSIQHTHDGGYVIAGYTASFGEGGTDVYLVRIDSAGDTLWTRTYGTAVNEWGHSVEQTADNGYIISGSRRSPVGPAALDMYVVRAAANGDSIWTKTYGVGDVNESAMEIREIADGEYVAAGEYQVFGIPGDAYLVKMDSNGDTVWTRVYSGSYLYDCDAAFSLDLTTDGGYVLAGYTGNCEFLQENFYIVRTDANGDTLWTSAYGGSDMDYAHSVRQTLDGGYIVVGETWSYGSGGDIYVLKLACDLAGIDRTETASGISLNLTSRPNPSNGRTTIEYLLPSSQSVRITIYNLLGHEISQPVNTKQGPGRQTVFWNGRLADGSPVSPGVYLCRLQAGQQVSTHKIVRIK